MIDFSVISSIFNVFLIEKYLVLQQTLLERHFWQNNRGINDVYSSRYPFFRKRWAIEWYCPLRLMLIPPITGKEADFLTVKMLVLRAQKELSAEILSEWA